MRVHGETKLHTVKTKRYNRKLKVVRKVSIPLKIDEDMTIRPGTVDLWHSMSLGELAAGVAHEINNPINSIINYAQLLVNKSNEGSEQNDIASRIIKEGQRIAVIVNGFLSYSKPGDKKEKYCKSSLNEILSEAIAITEEQLRKDGIRIINNLKQKQREIIAHPQLIQQVFLNIINNARYALNKKYPESDVDKILEISSEEIMIHDRPYISLVFHDRGIGIQPGVINKVMNPFFTTKPKGEGTGLGLSISQAIVNNHGGKIVIDSIVGEYTRVTIVLPVSGLR